jgi:hypothetical protein
MSSSGAAAVRLPVEITRQPDGVTCGPTCLHAIYRYHGDELPLEEIIAGTRQVVTGGTLVSHLACHAQARGYRCTIYTWNHQVFDPSWFKPGVDQVAKLREQVRWKGDQYALVEATRGYVDFLRAGGRLTDEDLTGRLIRRHLARGVPVLTGLSATYLYRAVRQYGPEGIDDDIRGRPEGHFVIIDGYNPKRREFSVSDPYIDHPMADGQRYVVSEARLLAAIMLGITTYDANLLVVEPEEQA